MPKHLESKHSTTTTTTTNKCHCILVHLINLSNAEFNHYF